MITRLKVSGFKNLVGVDIRFSPFTCIAGANGVGKSNLFDAIQFLSALSDRPLVEAAKSVRDENGKTTDISSLFHRLGNTHDPTMKFEVEMLIPKTGQDDLGQEAEASSTFLRYTIELKYCKPQSYLKSSGSLEILHEELVHIKKKELEHSLMFDYSTVWLNSVFKAQARKAPFISTDKENDTGEPQIRLHQDSGTEKGRRGGAGGKPRRFLAQKLPRTVLSDTNATESPTALLARREMQSWRILQLEPSSLRKPDDFMAVSEAMLGVDGSHLPATLYRLAHDLVEIDESPDLEGVYSQVANQLSELINDVKSISIDRDEKRQLLTLLVKGKDGTFHPAKALSDGTLRFLALAVLALDPRNQGVMALEEPENGIHPQRIPAILNLLQKLTNDINQPVDSYNPLRQVIINTHSPAVVQQVPEDSLLIAELKEQVSETNQRYKGVTFSDLPNTWRSKIKEENSHHVSMGQLLAYLNPVLQDTEFNNENEASKTDDNSQESSYKGNHRPKKVYERADIQQLTLALES